MCRPAKQGGGVVEDDKASQIVTLQNRLEDVENKLAAEKIVVEQLRAINADQSKQLVQAEALVKSETEKHSAEMWLLYDETTTAKEEAGHENEVRGRHGCAWWCGGIWGSMWPPRRRAWRWRVLAQARVCWRRHACAARSRTHGTPRSHRC